ncbi:MAG: hypothetical protein H6765_09100 [Candidatus Peribacteria bacterium]|nr:MAG: hypothetical protein H6765_09100 [Candidatus Peribacteria bacterium]
MKRFNPLRLLLVGFAIFTIAACDPTPKWTTYICNGDEIIRLEPGLSSTGDAISDDCELVGMFNCSIKEGNAIDALAIARFQEIKSLAETFSDNKCIVGSEGADQHAVTHFLSKELGRPISWGFELELRNSNQDFLGSIAILQRTKDANPVMYQVMSDSVTTYSGYNPGPYKTMLSYLKK